MTAENGGRVSGPIAVAVVTGDPARLRQLMALLETDARLQLVHCDGSDVDAVHAIAARPPEDDGSAVVVVDVPSRLGDDLKLVRSISKGTNEASIVVVGPKPDLALATLIAGASGVVTREPSAQELCDAVACVADGDAAVTAEVATSLVRRYQRLDEELSPGAMFQADVPSSGASTAASLCASRASRYAGIGPPANIGRRRAAPMRPARQAVLRGDRFAAFSDYLRHRGGEGEGAAECRRDHDETHGGMMGRRIRRRVTNLLHQLLGNSCNPTGSKLPTDRFPTRLHGIGQYRVRRPVRIGAIPPELRRFLPPRPPRRTTTIRPCPPSSRRRATPAAPDRGPQSRERRAIREQLLHAGGIDVVADTGDGERVVRLVHRMSLPCSSPMYRSRAATAWMSRRRSGRRRPACTSVLRRCVGRGRSSWRRCEPRWASS